MMHCFSWRKKRRSYKFIYRTKVRGSVVHSLQGQHFTSFLSVSEIYDDLKTVTWKQ